jgi:hypothetical protein
MVELFVRIKIKAVIPAGSKRESILFKEWIPAFAGMTKCAASVVNLIFGRV